MYNSINDAGADACGIKSECLDPSEDLDLGGEEEISMSGFRETENREENSKSIILQTKGFDEESSSDDVDIKHEPLEPDVEDYVSITAGVMHKKVSTNNARHGTGLTFHLSIDFIAASWRRFLSRDLRQKCIYML